MDVDEIELWPPIYLAWRQLLAAYWSIAWPSGAAASALLFVATLSWPADTPSIIFQLAGLIVYFAWLICQALFVRRLVRKRYRSFRIEVRREDSAAPTRLAMADTLQFWFRLAWPQAALLFLLVGVSIAGTSDPNGEIRQGWSGLLLPANLLIVGPYALGFAIRNDYPTFRLLAYGQRYV